MLIPLCMNNNRKKQYLAIEHKFDLIEQNQCYFWIQRIKIV